MGKRDVCACERERESEGGREGEREMNGRGEKRHLGGRRGGRTRFVKAKSNEIEKARVS